MPSDYVLKRNVMDSNRIKKIAKRVIEDCHTDRKLALECYKYFKNMVDENPTDSVAKNLMTDCLKLAQTSKTNVIKVMDLIVKLESRGSQDAGNLPSTFRELEKLTSEQKN